MKTIEDVCINLQYTWRLKLDRSTCLSNVQTHHAFVEHRSISSEIDRSFITRCSRAPRRLPQIEPHTPKRLHFILCIYTVYIRHLLEERRMLLGSESESQPPQVISLPCSSFFQLSSSPLLRSHLLLLLQRLQVRELTKSSALLLHNCVALRQEQHQARDGLQHISGSAG